MNIEKFLSELDINKISDDTQKLGFMMAKKKLWLNNDKTITPVNELKTWQIESFIVKLEEDNYYPVQLYITGNYEEGKVPNIWYDILLEELGKRSIN